ncbi:17137_t:CDS:2 [Funneliformis caledonium]|uniref:17137_t:CDS:1 n=1 Tax=Funneliformis caledonium TaxID=1117310 RepID=A0A9N8ZDK2_9GLOM|nr:17137_t:CDS:2 [Funneliformis caledonium]
MSARSRVDVQPCDKLGVGINYGVCWVYNWESHQLKGDDPLPGDYDIWVHAYYAPI